MVAKPTLFRKRVRRSETVPNSHVYVAVEARGHRPKAYTTISLGITAHAMRYEELKDLKRAALASDSAAMFFFSSASVCSLRPSSECASQPDGRRNERPREGFARICPSCGYTLRGLPAVECNAHLVQLPSTIQAPAFEVSVTRLTTGKSKRGPKPAPQQFRRKWAASAVPTNCYACQRVH